MPQPMKDQYYLPKKKAFHLPAPSKTNDNAIAYLRLRGIDAYIIAECIKAGTVFESSAAKYTNVVFAGFDSQNCPRYAALRGCMGSFKGEVAGSDKRFAFKMTAQAPNNSAHVFESAIDALSYATILLNEDKDWRAENLLSLGGIPPASIDTDRKTVPQAIVQYLADNPGTSTIHLHLDNDEPGLRASDAIATALYGRCEVSLEQPKAGKDINDWLMARRSALVPTPANPEGRSPIKDSQTTNRYQQR